MTIQPMISFKRFAVGLTVALSLFAAVWSSHSQAASGATPALPDELKKQSGGKMVLLDFYSDYCGTCRMAGAIARRASTGKNFAQGLTLTVPGHFHQA